MPLFRDRRKDEQAAVEQAEAEAPTPPGPWMLMEGPLFAPWYMRFRLLQEIERSRRYGNALSILIAEPQLITNERLNEEGLLAAAQAAINSGRATDLVGWMGDGQRIMIILAETDAPSGRFAVARLRDEMWLMSRSSNGYKWTITLVDDLERIAQIAGAPPQQTRGGQGEADPEDAQAA